MERETYTNYERIKATGAIRELVSQLDYEVDKGNFRIACGLARTIVDIAEKYIKEGTI